MKRSILATALVLVGLSSSIMSCSRASVVCDLVCECEHCNDQAKVQACNQFGAAEDVADSYDCGDKWEAYTVCIEERGKCDNEQARFSTQNDTGEDRCQDESDALNKCIDNASAHNGTNGGIK